MIIEAILKINPKAVDDLVNFLKQSDRADKINGLKNSFSVNLQ